MEVAVDIWLITKSRLCRFDCERSGAEAGKRDCRATGGGLGVRGLRFPYRQPWWRGLHEDINPSVRCDSKAVWRGSTRKDKLLKQKKGRNDEARGKVQIPQNAFLMSFETVKSALTNNTLFCTLR